MARNLAERHCKPCEGGVEPLRPEQSRQLLKALHDGWSMSDDGREIARSFEFKAYSKTMGFVNAVAWIAVTEGHHPVMRVEYGSCRVSFTTHAIDGLSDNDFICAAKVDRLVAEIAE